ncbi:MAG TPA: PAS domain-containing protein [Gammaproteobacteria bacterium]|nr:PAS domain-containing protein [Gammaproteobacteria bacterium]
MNSPTDSDTFLPPVLNAMGVGLWRLDPASGALEWSSSSKPDAAAVSSPATLDEFYEMVHPDDREKVRSALQHAIDSSEPYHATYRLIWPDRPLQWLEARGQAVRDDAGRTTSVIGILTDVTRRRSTEMALRDVRERLTRAMDYGHVGTWTIEWPDRKVYVDPYIADLFSVKPGEEDGGPLQSYIDAIHLEDRERVRHTIEDAFGTRVYHEIEYRIVHPESGLRWVSARSSVECDAAGEPLRMAGVLLDITDRKAAEAALQASEEHLALAVDAADIGTWDNEIVDGELGVGWSTRCKTLFGLPADAVVTPAMRESLIHPQDRERFHQVTAQAMDPAGNGEYDNDYRVLLPEGGVRWLISKGRCIFEGRGKARRPVRFIGIVIDVTERRESDAERRRRQENDRFLNQVGAVLTASLDYDETLRRVAGMCVPYLADWAFVDLLTKDRQLRRIEVAYGDPRHAARAEALKNEPPRRDPFDNPLAQALLEGRPLLLPDASGTLREALAHDPGNRRIQLIAEAVGDDPMSLMSIPLVARGKTLGMLSLLSTTAGRVYDEQDVAIGEDLARRAALAMDNARLYRQAEEHNQLLREQTTALQEADRRKNEFLAVLAHELRNPLAPLSANLHVLRLAGGDNPRLKRAQAVMERQVNHLVRLVDDLLDISRVSRGRIDLRRSRVRLNDLIDNAIEISRPLIDERRHELTISVPPAPAWLDADAERLTQVFVNLLNNAAKFTPPGGSIVLTAEVNGAMVSISIRDNGIGIDGDELARIFDLFVQGREELQSGTGGLGIGLTLAKQLVEMHRGAIEASSPGADSGSEFIVTLPLAAAREPAVEPAKDTLPSGPGASRRVLVIDDHQDIADSMTMLLEMMGHEARAAYSGAAGLEAGAEFKPEIVFLDIGMPEMNGHEAAARIRAEDWGADVRLVALTGWGQEEDRRRSREAGFDMHLVKPIEADMLEKLLAEME